MSLQIDLFASAETMQKFRDRQQFSDARLHPDEKPRLYKQTIKILQAFVDEPNSVSSFELNKIANRYSARIYEIRKVGIKIKIVGRDFVTGEVLYHFKTPEDRERAKGYL